MNYSDVNELDKRITIHTAWNAGTSYDTLIIGSEATFRELYTLNDGSFNEENRKYKGFLTRIDNDLELGQLVLSSIKKGDNE